jgi:hypothetical protein
MLVDDTGIMGSIVTTQHNENVPAETASTAIMQQKANGIE